MKIDNQAILRFFRGECTKAEAKQIAQYLKSHKEIMDTLFDEVDWLHSLNDVSHLRSSYQEDVLLEALREQLYAQKKKGLVKSMQPWIKWSAAACVAILGILTFLYFIQGTGKSTVSGSTGEHKLAAIGDSIIWQNNSTQRESRYLSDGSQIYLEPGSVLRYRKNFEPARRLLHLEGMAKFVVAKNKNRPFTVIAGDINTTAIGTIFTVSSFSKKHPITVKLLEGKVMVKNIKRPGNSMYLLPGELCAFDGRALYKVNALASTQRSPKGGTQVKTNMEDSTCQLDQTHVVFKNAELPSVFKALGKLYIADILYKDMTDSVLSKTLYSGSFDKTKMKAADAIRIVSLVNDLNWEQVDSVTYLISPQQ